MKKLLIPVLALSLFLCGCSSSSSGGSDAPAANYSGTYLTVVDNDTVGEITIVQDGSDAALTIMTYAYDIVGTSKETTIDLVDKLGHTGVGKVKSRKMDIGWETGAFTRLEFSRDGSSFSAYGDFSFAGVKLN